MTCRLHMKFLDGCLSASDVDIMIAAVTPVDPAIFDFAIGI